MVVSVGSVALGIRRQRVRRGGDRSLTAASVRITDPSKAFRATLIAGTNEAEWQEQAWDYVDVVSELGYYVNWRVAAASRCRLIASEVDPDTRIPTGFCEDAEVVQLVADIGGSAALQAQLIGRMTGLLTVPGEGYYAVLARDPSREVTLDRTPPVPGVNGMPEAGTEQWFALSRAEIARKTSGRDGLSITLPDGTKHAYNADVDVLFRVWNPDLRKAVEATSAVRSNRDALNEIVRSTAAIDNASRSRLVGNGVLFVPQEMSLPQQQSAPTAESVGGPTVDTLTAATPALGATGAQQLQDMLYDVGTTAYQDQNSMAAFMPIIAAAPGEWIKNVQHLKFDSTVPETAIATRDKAITRLARGLDVSPERLLGMGESNHWSAWLLDEQDVKVHISPVLERICAAFTESVFRDALAALGRDPDQFVVWYDATDLTQDPDKTSEAEDAYGNGAITADAYRRYLGLDVGDGYDLTTKTGWEELARDRAAQDVNLIPLLAPLLGPQVEDIAAPPAPAIAAPPPDDEDDAVIGEPPDEDNAPDEDDPEPPPQQSASAGHPVVNGHVSG